MSSPQRSVMTDPFSLSRGPEPRNWTPIVVTAVVVVAIVAGLLFVSQRRSRRVTQPDAYSPKLAIEGGQFSEARNFVGATVTYLDLRVKNTGERTVTGGLARLIFRNRLNEVVQRETVPIRVLEANKLGGYPDVLDLSVAPLASGQSRSLRLVMEHVSTDWNRGFPEVQFINLQFK